MIFDIGGALYGLCNLGGLLRPGKEAQQSGRDIFTALKR